MPKTYYISRKDRNRIRASAVRADIHEVCFALFGRGGRIERVIKVPNRAEDTVLHSLILTRDIRRIRSELAGSKLQLLALLHSHPLSRSIPSRGDIQGNDRGSLIFIYSEIYDELRAFRITRNGRGYVEKGVVVV